MTVLDDRLVPLALELVAKFGKVVTFKEVTKDYTAATGDVVESGVTNHSVKVTPPEKYDDALINGDLIQIGDTKISLPKSGLLFTPIRGMQVTIDSITWKIEKVSPIYTGEQIALYELQLRK